MDLHQIGTRLGSGSYAQQEQQQSTTSTPSSSVSPSTRQHPQHFHQHQRQHQLYNIHPPQPHDSSSSWPRSRDLPHQHQQQQQLQPQQSNIKLEIMGKHLGTGNGSKNADDSMPSASDFVKKLYKMLEDPSFRNVVSWGPLGDCFVVKDMNDFTKSILPRMFKHSNFASFVRQLNKYDFHKVKNTDDNIFGEHSWTFRHPDFHADRREALENIKRKVPAQRKTTNVPNSTTTSLSSSTNNNNHHHNPSSPSMQPNPHSHSHHTTTSSPYPRRSPSPTCTTSTSNTFHLQQEISELKSRLVNLESNFETRLNDLETNYETRLHNLESGLESRLRGLEMGYEGRMRGLEKNYESVLVELVGFQRGVAQQDGVVKSLIRCFLGEDGKLEDGPGHYQYPNRTPSLPFPQSQSQSQSQCQPLNVSPHPLPQAQLQPQQSQSQPISEAPSHSDRSLFLPQDTVQRILDTSSTMPPTTTPKTTTEGGNENANLRWGSSRPDDGGDEYRGRDVDADEDERGKRKRLVPFGGNVETATPLPSSSSPPSSSSSSSSQQKLRVRQATFVPSGWAVPPRVLLVDDDAVIRKLSSKFLKIFGCSTDVAVDGIGAVTKMNLEKYDLVLMDILMPKLDGISATNLIRKFDRGTPIISMTVNSKPNEIMEYYSSGMNDILPKPFTKEGLLDMLEKHLMHLKVMQQMTVVPRSVGIPPLSDANFEQVLKTNAITMVEHQQQMHQRHSVTALELLVSGRNTADGHSTTNTLSPPIPLSQQQLVHQQHPSQISFTSLLSMGEDDVRINNPLAGMGLSDEHYSIILQNYVNGERFTGMDEVGGSESGSGGIKRTIDDVGFTSDKREGKRSRFEVIE